MRPDIQKYLVFSCMELVQTFNTTLNDFIGNLKRCYPTDTTHVHKIDNIQDTRPLQQFMKCVGQNTDKISNKDVSLFDTPFVCVKDFDLSVIVSKSTEKNNTAIWKFLQTLTLIGTTIRSKSTNLEDFFEQFNNETFMNHNTGIQQQMINIVQKLMEDVNDNEDNENNENNEDNEDSASDNDAEEKNPADAYTDMFQNTKIGNLAKEIAEDIDMSAFDMSNMESPDVSTIIAKTRGRRRTQKSCSICQRKTQKENGIW